MTLVPRIRIMIEATQPPQAPRVSPGIQGHASGSRGQRNLVMAPAMWLAPLPQYNHLQGCYAPPRRVAQGAGLSVINHHK